MSIEGSEKESKFECFIRSSNFELRLTSLHRIALYLLNHAYFLQLNVTKLPAFFSNCLSTYHTR